MIDTNSETLSIENYIGTYFYMTRQSGGVILITDKSSRSNDTYTHHNALRENLISQQTTGLAQARPNY